MTVATVEANVERGSIRLNLSGEIDLANAAAVEEEILGVVSDEPTAVSVDLADLTYMDSSGGKDPVQFGVSVAGVRDCAATHRAAGLAHPPTNRAIGVRVAGYAPPRKHLDSTPALSSPTPNPSESPTSSETRVIETPAVLFRRDQAPIS